MATVETPRKEVRAEARYVRTAPRKAQLVLEQIRGRRVPEARTVLAFMTRDAARDVEKVLHSAVANAEANHDLVGDELVVSSAYAGDGPTLKRWRARARGRVARVRKRTCHITIGLSPTEERAGREPARPAPTRSARAEKPAREDRAEEAAKPKRDEAAKPKRAPRRRESQTEDKES